MKPYKRYGLAADVNAMESLGQLGGSEYLEEDIKLCTYQTIEPYFRMYLPKSEKILEAGAGRGRWVFYLRRLGYDVIGIDIASSDIDFAKRYDASVPIVYENVLHTSFPDNSLGAVISLGVVEHFEKGPQQAFAEVGRVLKPGGIFLVTVPTQNPIRVLLFNRLKDMQLLYRKIRKIKIAFEEYRYSRRQFTVLLRNAGFTIVEIVPDDFLPPKNMGLYTGSHYFQHKSRKWELNNVGSFVNVALRSISPWLHSSGALWVCRKST